MRNFRRHVTRPRPLSPRTTGKVIGATRLSESEESTVVAGRTETDESATHSRELTSADDLHGSQSTADLGTESDSVGGSASWDMARKWTLNDCADAMIVAEISAIMKTEMQIAGKFPSLTNKFRNGKGTLIHAANICGFGRSHVSMVFFLWIC